MQKKIDSISVGNGNFKDAWDNEFEEMQSFQPLMFIIYTDDDECS